MSWMTCTLLKLRSYPHWLLPSHLGTSVSFPLLFSFTNSTLCILFPYELFLATETTIIFCGKSEGKKKELHIRPIDPSLQFILVVLGASFFYTGAKNANTEPNSPELDLPCSGKLTDSEVLKLARLAISLSQSHQSPQSSRAPTMPYPPREPSPEFPNH